MIDSILTELAFIGTFLAGWLVAADKNRHEISTGSRGRLLLTTRYTYEYYYGEGANGKSVFLDVLKAAAGKKNFSNVTLKGLNSASTRYLIDGKLFNVAEENSVGSLTDSDMFKIMVTGGYIQLKKLFVQEYEVENRCKLVISCNDLPRSMDRTEGLYRRMLLVPFRAKFDDARGNKDPFLIEKLKEELPGILNIAIAGYSRLLANKKFTDSVRGNELLDMYRIENDPMTEWFMDHVVITDKEEDAVPS